MTGAAEASTAVARHRTLTIAEILDQPPLVPLWPTVGQALGLAASTTYQLAAENRLPIEVIRIGRRRMARLVDLHRFLGLLPEDEDAAGYQPAAPSGRKTQITSQ